MNQKLLAVVLLAALSLLGCSSGGSSDADEAALGSISIELPEIAARGLPGVKDIASYVVRITSKPIEYSDTIESKTGGIITVDKLAEARYEISVEALDAKDEVILNGEGSAYVYVGEVTYAQIDLDYIYGQLDIAVTLPGQDFLTTLELSGLELDETEPVRVINGPGIIIERVPGGPFNFIAGLPSSKVFAIETGGSNAADLKLWFDNFPDLLRDANIIINDTAGNESYRWSMLAVSPLFYEDNEDDSAQFYMSVTEYVLQDYNALDANYNLETDNEIEIEGVVFEVAAEVVADDTEENILVLEFVYETGVNETYDWTKVIANGNPERKAMSVITNGPGGFGDEISRRNYYEVFPIRFEQVNGFGTDIKGKFRLMLSYAFAEEA